eukprot:symbB.v1.2.031930.t2/scaffold3763.1/size50786/1
MAFKVAAAARRALWQRGLSPVQSKLSFAPCGLSVRRFSRNSWESGDDVDLDSVAYGFMASQALFTGLEVGVFDQIAGAGEKGCSAEVLQKACSVEGPRMTTLLTALTAVKCIRRGDGGLYTLSPNTAKFMVTNSKQYYGDYLLYQIGRQFYHRMGALPEVMKTGKAPSYASWFSDPEVAKTYTQAQRCSVLDSRQLASCALPLGKLRLEVPEGRIPVAIIAPGSFSPPTLLHLRMFEEATVLAAFSQPHCHHLSRPAMLWNDLQATVLQSSAAICLQAEAAVSDSDWIMVDGRIFRCSIKDAHGQCSSPRVPQVISRFAAELRKVAISIGSKSPEVAQVRTVMLCGSDVLESFNATKTTGERIWSDEEIEVILGQHGAVCVGRTEKDLKAYARESPILVRHSHNLVLATPRAISGISSSVVRQHLAANESIRYLVHDKVRTYIFDHKLNELLVETCPKTSKLDSLLSMAQHNGSVATAKYLVKKKLQLGGIESMLDVGGGSGAFSYVFTEATPGLKSTVLELPEVCRTGESIKTQQTKDIQDRVNFVELDATSPDWPVSDSSFDIVLMSYISGSVPESVILPLYKNAFKVIRDGLVTPIDVLPQPCKASPGGIYQTAVFETEPGSKAHTRRQSWSVSCRTCAWMRRVCKENVFAALASICSILLAIFCWQSPYQIASLTFQVPLAAAGSTIETLEQADLSEEELSFPQTSLMLSIFKTASNGKDEDAFLWQDAVAPPSELLEEERDAEDLRNLSDEQLLEDAPAIGVKVQDLNTTILKPKQEMRYGTLTDQVPTPEKPLWKQFEEEQARKAGKAPEEPFSNLLRSGFGGILSDVSYQNVTKADVDVARGLVGLGWTVTKLGSLVGEEGYVLEGICDQLSGLLGRAVAVRELQAIALGAEASAKLLWKGEGRESGAALLVRSEMKKAEDSLNVLRRIQQESISKVVPSKGTAMVTRWPTRLEKRLSAAGDSLALRQGVEKAERNRWIDELRHLLWEARLPAMYRDLPEDQVDPSLRWQEKCQMSRSNAVKNVLEEIAVRLEGSEPRFTRKAWHMPVAVVRALEESVVDRELTRFVRAYAWFRLLKLWAGLRFSDTKGLPYGSLKMEDHGLSGVLAVTKTTGPGKKIALLKLYVSREAWIEEGRWLEEGWAIWEAMTAEKGYKDRDFFLPMPSRDLEGIVRKMSHYYTAAQMSQALFSELMVKRRGDFERLLEAGVGTVWTEHTERVTLRTWAASAGVPDRVMKLLGRWSPSVDQGYERQNRKDVLKAQEFVASFVKRVIGGDDPFDEALVMQAVAERMDYLGYNEEEIAEQVDKLRTFRRSSLAETRKRPLEVMAKEWEEPEDDEKNDSDRREGEAPVEGHDPMDEEEVSDVEDAASVKVPLGHYVISVVGRSRRKMLHRVGECFRRPREHYAVFERVGSEPPEPARHQAEAEASLASLPSPFNKVEAQDLRQKFEQLHYKLEDKVSPATSTLELIFDQVESGEWKSMSLVQFLSRDDTEAEMMGATIDKTGTVKIRKGYGEAKPPKSSEELRQRLKLVGHTYIMAQLKFPHKAALQQLTPNHFSKLCDYLLGEQVMGLRAKDEEGAVVSSPSLELVLSYEFQIRKQMVKLMNEGEVMREALDQAMKDGVVKERFFLTPAAYSAITAMGGRKEKSRSPRRDRWQGGQSFQSSGSGGGKGKKGGKGRKGGGKILHSKTPDGREICYAWNNRDQRDDDDLSQEAKQEEILRRIGGGEFDAVICTPPCSTWSRVRAANMRGPPPIRDKNYPWGYPWVKKKFEQELQLGNILVRFTIRVVESALGVNKVFVLVEHPKDLGTVVREEDKAILKPASIWQLPDLRRLVGIADAILEHCLDRHTNPPEVGEKGACVAEKAGSNEDRDKRKKKKAEVREEIRSCLEVGISGKAEDQCVREEALGEGGSRRQGQGPPMQCFYKGKHRTIHDGGGLCSPGRWPVDQRTPLKERDGVELAAVVRAQFLRWLLGKGEVEVKDVFWKLAGGQHPSSPFEEIIVGVRLGVDEELPRVPKVFEPKEKWNLDFVEEALRDSVADNYKSAEESAEDIERQVREEVDRGSIAVLSEEEVKERYKGRLAVEEEVKKAKGAVRFSLIYDISRAHKLIPVAEKDWGLQAFRLPGNRAPGKVFLHTRGTFGISSAAYWWQRLAAVMVRTAHRLAGRDMGVLHLLFADDGWMVAMGEFFWRRLLFWLFVLEVMGVPLSYKKLRGGTRIQWIGYQLDVGVFEKGISDSKVRWILGWIEKKKQDGGATGRELKSALGRLSFVAGALQHIRPFLGPLFAWASALALGTFAKFPEAVRSILSMVEREVVRKPMSVPRKMPPLAKEIFRVDAKAEKDLVVIGGRWIAVFPQGMLPASACSGSEYETDKPIGPSTEGIATPSAGGGRENVEITQLFRQACDENNLLSFESLKEISEIDEMLLSEDLAEEELLDMWEDLPKKKGDFIDVLAFRDLLAKIDELFEYVEEDALMQFEGGGLAKAKKRSLQTVKQELLDAINQLDGEVIKLAGELEDIWRDQVGDLNDFDGAKLQGLWELIYSTSVKFRRWGSVLNAVRDIKNAKFEALIQNFGISGDDGYNEYDMEEVFKAKESEESEEEVELSMRGQGSWKLGIQQNVVTGDEDLVVKLEVTGVEYDTLEDTVENCGEKTLMSPMCRTFSYGFISYMDDKIRVMRTSLTGRSALRPGGRLLVHDFMVNDTLDGPALGALWGLQHVTVNANGLGLCPAEIIQRMGQAGFEQQKCEAHEMIQGMTKLIVAHKSA